MTVLQFFVRLIVNVWAAEATQQIVSEAARKATRTATAAIVREVQRRTKAERSFTVS